MQNTTKFKVIMRGAFESIHSFIHNIYLNTIELYGVVCNTTVKREQELTGYYRILPVLVNTHQNMV
jgi:hypothetical protein